MNKQYLTLKYFLFLFITPVICLGQVNIPVIIHDRDQHETFGAVNPINPKIMVASWNDFRSSANLGYVEPGYAFSTNGGLNWFGQNVLQGIPNTPYGFDPSVAINRNGKVFYCYIASTGGNLGAVYVSRTNIDAINWLHTKVSNHTDRQDKPIMAIDNTGGIRNGNIYVTWISFTDGVSIRFARSTDGGNTFQENALPIAEKTGEGPFGYFLNPETAPSGLGAPYPIVGPNGEVYVIWKDDYFKKILITRSLNGGLTFESPSEIGQCLS